MKFSEAVKLLEEGKKVKDINWYGKRFIFYDKDLQEIYDEIREPYPISGEDLEIIWEEYIEPETKKIEIISTDKKEDAKYIDTGIDANEFKETYWKSLYVEQKLELLFNKSKFLEERMNELCGEKQ